MTCSKPTTILFYWSVNWRKSFPIPIKYVLIADSPIKVTWHHRNIQTLFGN